MPYSPLLIKPMKEELTSIGFRDLASADDVQAWMKETSGTALLVVNSVSGAAAGMARPGVRLALERSEIRPDRLGTVFADQDLEATGQARSYFADVPPSEPSIALFKDGELVYFRPRHRVEGRDPETIAQELMQVFQEFCAR